MERISFQEIPKGIIENLRKLEDFINTSSIETSLLELVRLRVSQLNGCAYCVDMHHKELRHAKETDLRLSSLVVWRETPYFSSKERIVLFFAEALTLLDSTPLKESLFTSLETYFTKEEIALLTMAIAQINTWNRLMKSFRFAPGNYELTQ